MTCLLLDFADWLDTASLRPGTAEPLDSLGIDALGLKYQLFPKFNMS